MKSKPDHTMLVIAIGLPGALLVGCFGCFVAMINSAFGGASAFGGLCLTFWGLVGGACVGAIPGLIYGLFHGVRRAIADSSESGHLFQSKADTDSN